MRQRAAEVRRRDRQSPPALRRRGRPAERVRRGHSRSAATPSSTRRTSSRTWRRSTSASRSATTASTTSRATSTARSARSWCRTANAPTRCATTSSAIRDDAARAVLRRAADAALRAAGRDGAGEPQSASAPRRSSSGSPTTARRWSRALEALEADVALTQGPAGGRAGARPPRRGAARRVRFLLRADDPGFVYYLEIARPRRVPARRRRSTSPRSSASCCSIACTATVLTSATLTVDGSFDYVRGRLGIATAQRDAAGLGVRLRAPGDPLSAAEACPTRARRSSSARRRARSSRSSSGRTGAPSCCSPATPTCARSTASRRPSSSIRSSCRARAPRSALLRDFKATPQRRAARDVQLLAGRRRRRRGAELRDHRQAAVRLARRSDHGRAHRGDHGARADRRSANTRCRSPSWR